MKRVLITILILICASLAFAQTETTTATTTAAKAEPAEKAENAETGETTTNVVVGMDASETRHQFAQLLERHPPQVARVLKLDPTLFSNQPYLANYPALSAFLTDHPEIAHTPAYYLDSVYIGETRAQTPSERMWNDVTEGIAIFFTIGIVLTVLVWLVKTVVEHRRWSRLSKVQAEVHTKLMDRFATNEDLFNYIQTPAGKRFLESAPLQLDATPARQTPAPVNRILWSVQIGVVIFAIGMGMQFMGGRVPDVSQPLYALGILAISVGLGFILSAFVSFILSRKLGLWSPSVEPSGPVSE